QSEVEAARVLSPEQAAFRAFCEAMEQISLHRYTDALELARKAVGTDPGFARAQLLVVLLSAVDGYGPHSEGRAALTSLQSARERLAPRDRALLDAILAAIDSDPIRWNAPHVEPAFRGQTSEARSPFDRYLKAHQGDMLA